MICGYAKREIEEDDRSLEAFGDFRLKLIEREARLRGFAVRRVPDGDGECVEVYSAGGSGLKLGHQ